MKMKYRIVKVFWSTMCSLLMFFLIYNNNWLFASFYAFASIAGGFYLKKVKPPNDEKEGWGLVWDVVAHFIYWPQGVMLIFILGNLPVFIFVVISLIIGLALNRTGKEEPVLENQKDEVA